MTSRFFLRLVNHVISWSGGKDSTATIILFHEHYQELVKYGDTVTIIFVEVMYDLERNISGHTPEMVRFIYSTAEKFRSWGFEVNILRSDRDFLSCFNRKIADRAQPERRGRTHGFMLSKGKCDVKRDCKLRPIRLWKKAHHGEDIIEYIGIAYDEPKRYSNLTNGRIESLLCRYELTEDDARSLCEQYGMLAPQYYMNEGKQNRDGCWFCCNAKLCELAKVKEEKPDLWEEFMALEDVPNLVYPKWGIYKKAKTLREIDELI